MNLTHFLHTSSLSIRPFRSLLSYLLLLSSIVILLSSTSTFIQVTECSLSSSFNPYAVLGVGRKATIPEIKQAFKNLARKYHPDKNKEDGSEDRFMDINRAYNLLTDPKRRIYYDKTGLAEDLPSFESKPDFGDPSIIDFDTFESYFNAERSRFKHTSPSASSSFSSSSSSSFPSSSSSSHPFPGNNHYFRKHSITFRAYENNVFPNSFTKPYIIVFYGDLCPQCSLIEQQLPKIMRELEGIGVGFATIDILHESSLARKMGVRTLPYMMSLMDGEIRPFREDKVTLGNLVEFIRRALPKGLISKVTDNTYEDFLMGWGDNKVRVLFVNEDPLIKLRYFLVAYYFRDRIIFGHVNNESLEIRSRYHIDPKKSSMLTFNEDISRPAATLALQDLETKFMKDVLESNKYLQLPRITSQTMFDHLCPTGSLRSKVTLCVLLITSQFSPDYEAKFELMRNFMKESNFGGRSRVRFMFMYREKQPQFVKTLADGFDKINLNSQAVNIVVLWRREFDHVYYEWFANEWDVYDSNYVNQTREKLGHLLAKLSQNVNQFGSEARVNMLIDEDARSLFTRIFKRLILVTENLTDNIAHTDPMPFVSVTISIIIILVIGYIMAYFMRIEEQNIRAQKWNRQSTSSTSFSSASRCSSRSTNHGETPSRSVSKYSVLNIHELRGETYNGLVHLLKPGCRTLILICDPTTKTSLMPQFKRAIYPWRKNKTIYFAFLDIEKNLEWYRKILEQILGSEQALTSINPKNCVGTVLSLNGFRKYFCVYHAKHPEKNKSGGGAFLGMDGESGFDSSSDSDIESGMLMNGQRTPSSRKSTLKFYDDDEIILERNLLDGLKTWLSLLFEGRTTKYYINYWPENMK